MSEAAEHVEVADAVEPAVASPTAQEVALGSRLNKKLRVTEPRSITAVTHKVLWQTTSERRTSAYSCLSTLLMVNSSSPFSVLQVCNKCKQNLPAEAFCRQSNTSDGLNLWCKRCRSDRIKQWKKETWQKNAAARKEPDPEKQCAQCLENLPASAFFRDYSHRTGLEHFCKCCKKAIKTERLRVQREAALLGLPVPRKRKTQAEQVHWALCKLTHTGFWRPLWDQNRAYFILSLKLPMCMRPVGPYVWGMLQALSFISFGLILFPGADAISDPFVSVFASIHC